MARPDDAAPTTGIPLGPGRGTVVVFDDPRGLGVVRSEDGVEHPFHCTAVADGSRAVAVGTAVAYRVVPGRMGRWEATAITPLAGGG
jgi:cold shock CspA family protein